MDNFDFSTFLATYFSGPFLLAFFVKAFGIVSSIIFLVYTIVIHKQIEEINKTVTNTKQSILVFISFMQIFIVLCLVLFALFFL